MTESGRKKQPALISSEILLGSREAALEAGIHIDGPLLEHDISPGLLVSSENFLTRSQVAGFLDTVAHRFNCHHFGLLVGKHQPPLRLGRLAPIVKLSPDIRSAIENSLTYQPLYSEARIHRLTVEDGYARVTRWDPELAAGHGIQLNTLVIVQIFKILTALCENQWRPTAVAFSHAAPSEKQQYLRFFGCPVYFDREFDGVVFPEGELQRKISTADPELLKIVLAHYDELLRNKDQESEDILSVVSDYIRRQMGTKLCNQASCARYLDLHPRALHRTLADHKITFKALLGRRRMEMAEHYLRNSSIALAALAEMLGYRNPSAFSRAFKKAHGVSPVTWRKAHHVPSRLPSTGEAG